MIFNVVNFTATLCMRMLIFTILFCLLKLLRQIVTGGQKVQIPVFLGFFAVTQGRCVQIFFEDTGKITAAFKTARGGDGFYGHIAFFQQGTCLMYSVIA